MYLRTDPYPTHNGRTGELRSLPGQRRGGIPGRDAARARAPGCPSRPPAAPVARLRPVGQAGAGLSIA